MMGAVMTDSTVLMALGPLRFGLHSENYNRLRHRFSERWQAQDRAGATPALHWAGHGLETLSLAGVVFPHYHGSARFLQRARTEAQKGEPLLLVDGLGFFLGKWSIVSISETQPAHFADGAPRRQDFTIELQKYGETPIKDRLTGSIGP